MHTAWVEVDLEAVRHNYRQVKAFVGPNVLVMAVIKTNAYGHGLELVAGALRDEADWFGVSTIEEGIRARAAAPEARILVFHPVNAWNAEALVAHNLTATVDSEAGANALAGAGRAASVTPKAHLKIDTGMSRFGLPPYSLNLLPDLIGRPGIAWGGLYTHLSNSILSKIQLIEIKTPITLLAGMRCSAGLVHVLNSDGLLRFPDDRYSMVRTGTLLYGQYPSAKSPRSLDLRPTWRYLTRVVSVRDVWPGRQVGYGGEWEARRDSRIATIPVGYFDGFTVEPRSVWKRQGGLKGLVRRLRGQDAVTVKTPYGRAKVVGRVAAQSAMLDVTDLPDVKVGDIVEIPARRVLVGEHIPRVAK